MRLWLDDLRDPPPLWEDFFWARTAPAAIDALKSMEFEMVSLDHDLGDFPGAGDGYDVLLWIEEQVRLNGYKPPILAVHSSNPVARARMENAIRAILDNVPKE